MRFEISPLLLVCALQATFAVIDIRRVANRLGIAGYLNNLQTEEMSDDQLYQALRGENGPIRRYKRMHSLSDDDELDTDTMSELERARCSKPDDFAGGDDHRSKRYALLNDARYLWSTDEPVTVGFKDYFPGLPKATQEWVAMECAARWAEKSGLSFTLVRGKPANVYISFRRMDGPYNSIGTGESPVPFRKPPASALTLDSTENWVPTASSGQKGLSLEEGLCHEMGHTLSLGHSNDRNSIMYPSIQGGRSRVKLSSDDIRGIQRLYGTANGKAIIGSVPAGPGKGIGKLGNIPGGGSGNGKQIGLTTQSPSTNKNNTAAPDFNCDLLAGRKRKKCLRKQKRANRRRLRNQMNSQQRRMRARRPRRKF